MALRAEPANLGHNLRFLVFCLRTAAYATLRGSSSFMIPAPELAQLRAADESLA
jgi:hypothetical protein